MAYMKGHRVAPAAGCVGGNAPDVDVVDLWTLKAAQKVSFASPPPPKADHFWSSDALEWHSPTVLKLRLRLIGTDCQPVTSEPPVHLKLSVKDLKFR